MLLEKLMSKSSVEMAFLDGRKVAALCFGDIDLNNRPNDIDLFNCITNRDEVAGNISIPSVKFKGH